ncbi:MAG: hypothetical protein JWN04_6376 [Myxococcaceae bacterium]|nr:hypothetical protein [Myxococcaceae bacterium]
MAHNGEPAGPSPLPTPPLTQQQRKKLFSPGAREFLSWLAIATIASVYTFYSNVFSQYESYRIVVFRSYSVAFFVLLVPLLFRRIFGVSAVDALKNILAPIITRDAPRPRVTLAPTEVGGRASDESLPRDILIPSQQPYSSPASVETLRSLAWSSDKLAERIFARAGVYMLTGVVIAFIGLAFFYAETLSLSKVDKGLPLEAQLAQQLGLLVPRLGILFFIEFFAFFFLRQYRSAMDEFRYFEAIKRKRQEIHALVHIMQAARSRIDMADVAVLVEGGTFFSTTPILAAGDTTELLETKKLTKDEIDLFAKLIDTMSSFRK